MGRKYALHAWFFIAPFLLGFVVFQAIPLLYSLVLSFMRYDGLSAPQFIGFKNYTQLFGDKFLLEAFLNTWKIWLPNIISQIFLAFALAIILSNIRLKIRGQGLLRAIFYFPNIITAATIALIFSGLLDWQTGAINQLLFRDNNDAYISWFQNPTRARFIVSVLLTWMWFGNSLLILMAGFSSISPSFYEAAHLDGASSLQSFTRITLPLSRPILLYITITSFSGGMQMFDLTQVIAQSGQAPPGTITTLIMYLYQTAFLGELRIGYAASMSYLLLLFLMLFSILSFRIMGQKGVEK
ncbi:MAG: sugar ABC transporter permease [Spirochaetota bacterium]